MGRFWTKALRLETVEIQPICNHPKKRVIHSLIKWFELLINWSIVAFLILTMSHDIWYHDAHTAKPSQNSWPADFSPLDRMWQCHRGRCGQRHGSTAQCQPQHCFCCSQPRALTMSIHTASGSCQQKSPSVNDSMIHWMVDWLIGSNLSHHSVDVDVHADALW